MNQNTNARAIFINAVQNGIQSNTENIKCLGHPTHCKESIDIVFHEYTIPIYNTPDAELKLKGNELGRHIGKFILDKCNLNDGLYHEIYVCNKPYHPEDNPNVKVDFESTKFGIDLQIREFTDLSRHGVPAVNIAVCCSCDFK